MKQTFFLIFIIMLVVAVAGCTSQDTSSKSDNSFNQTNLPNNSAENNTSISNSSGSNKPSNAEYDASGYCNYVVDGDTIDVEGVGRIRFVGVDTPERGDNPGYTDAKNFLKSMVLGKTVQLDIDDKKRTDRYGRVLAVVYIDGVNLNRELLQRGYAEVLYIPPSEFNPYSWT